MLEEERSLVQRLLLEKNDEVQLTKRQIEEIDQEIAQARKDAELARKDADAAEVLIMLVFSFKIELHYETTHMQL